MKYRALILLIILSGCSKGNDPGVEAQKAASLASEALNKKDYALAEEYATKATMLKPQVVEYWTGLGRAEAAQGKKVEATQSYEQALELLNSEETQRYLDQAHLLAYLGREDEAQEKLEKYKTEKPVPSLNISTLLNEDTKRFRTR